MIKVCPNCGAKGEPVRREVETPMVWYDDRHCRACNYCLEHYVVFKGMTPQFDRDSSTYWRFALGAIAVLCAMHCAHDRVTIMAEALRQLGLTRESSLLHDVLKAGPELHSLMSLMARRALDLLERCPRT